MDRNNMKAGHTDSSLTTS